MMSACTFFFLFFYWFCLCGYACPVLDPFDPQYAWMDALIERDFADKKTISRDQFEHSIKIYKDNPWYQHLIVHDNQVTGPSELNIDFKALLIYLCECYGLPDLELLCYVHDGLHDSPQGNVPIFARCRRIGSKNTLLLHYGHGLSWVEDQCDRVEKLSSIPWSMLINKVHWRGNTTDGHGEYGGGYTVDNWFKHPRGKVCLISLHYPDLLDAAFVLEPQFGLQADQLKVLVERVLPQAPRASMDTCLNYKYQLLITGVLSPWTSDWKIHAGRAIFRHAMPWEVYWDPLFQPWEHYIPVAEDYSDFVDKMLWARWNDEECENMAMRSRIFMQTHARAEHMALYCYKALLRYTELLEPGFLK